MADCGLCTTPAMFKVSSYTVSAVRLLAILAVAVIKTTSSQCSRNRAPALGLNLQPSPDTLFLGTSLALYQFILLISMRETDKKCLVFFSRRQLMIR